VDYANERWVRLYVRDTTTWKLLPWEAKALLALTLRKVDRSGVLDVGDEGHEGLAAQVEMPPEVVEVAVGHLVKRGVLTFNGHAYVFPNFIDAQETPASDRQRAIESRANRRAKAMEPSRNVTPESRNVTQLSRAVTRGHAASHAVTPSDPSVPSDPTEREGGKPPPLALSVQEPEQTKPHPGAVIAIAGVTEINRLTGRNFNHESAGALRLCAALAKAGHTVDEAISVVRAKHAEWGADPKMVDRVAPDTLFALANFERYLEAIRAGPARPQTLPTPRRMPPSLLPRHQPDEP
jgi:uncharacterized phage protein (TIGR02220 family)